VKKKTINLTLSLLFLAAGTMVTFAATSYEHCRCNQASPGLGSNQPSTCCSDSSNNSYQNSNPDICCSLVAGVNKVWAGGSANWSTSYCKTPCLCLGTQTKQADYQEDAPGGVCCLSKPVGGGTLGGSCPGACTAGATQWCGGTTYTGVDLGGNGSYLQGYMFQTCGSDCTWGACTCPSQLAYNQCISAGGVWGFQSCNCLCCPPGSTAAWNGTQPNCTSNSNGQMLARLICTPQP